MPSPYSRLSTDGEEPTRRAPRPAPRPRAARRAPLPLSIPDPFAPPPHHHHHSNRDSSRAQHDDPDDNSSSSESALSLGTTPYDELERSSEGDEHSGLIGSKEKAHDLDDDAEAGWNRRDEARQRRRRFVQTAWLVALASLVLVAISFIAGNVLSPSTGLHTFKGQGLSRLTRGHLENGSFYPESVQLDWLAEAGDGVYSFRTDNGSIVLTDLDKNETRILVDGESVRDGPGGPKIEWSRFKVSADLKYILFDTDWTKQWRHSTFANFYVHDVASAQTRRLRTPSYPPATSFATFSPKDHHIAYVHRNDLYVLENPPVDRGGRDGEDEANGAIRVTTDGSPTVFNGVPDWVYEEEVFSSDTTTWWSPTGTKLSFLSFDESLVPTYDFPIYNSDFYEPGADTYPASTRMKYPKPGYPNPLVRIRVFDLERYQKLSRGEELDEGERLSEEDKVRRSLWELRLERPFDAEDEVVSEVVWIGRDELVVKVTNRIATVERVARFVLDAAGEEEDEEDRDRAGQSDRIMVGKVVREVDFDKLDQGWAEPGSNMVGIESTLLLHSLSSTSSAPIPSYPSGYLDIAPNSQGYNHLAYYSSADEAEPAWLTQGEWEIDGGIQMVDVKRGLVYFIAAKPSIERHLYSVPLPTSLAELEDLKADRTKIAPPTPLTEGLLKPGERGHFSVSFSPFGGVYQLNYEGPGIPWQKLVKVDEPDYSHTLTNNTDLARLDSRFQHAEIRYSGVKVNAHIDGYESSSSEQVELNAMEMRPPLMDVSGKTKYPVLFHVYGGPNSQTVTTRFQRDWHHYLCTALGYVVVRVDPRGTGLRGRRHRVVVKNRLGIVERQDVIEAAKIWSALPYIDEKRVGIWGWSYGGFLTTKVIEANSSVFQLGMAVAPVVDWALYDTVYTERYMSTPQLNPVGYENSSITEMDGFKHAAFALAHGTGDDNVHFQNSAALLDRFTVAHVRDFRFRLFTDSDHSMGMRGAYWELMTWLENFLLEKFGEGGRTKTKWKIKAEHAERD
ncbi:hypothetical protein JCM10212_003351 [Sporobolomyces blumeae]